ncbi:MAG: hypothetical protein AAFN04_16635, partial [Pseudomonadota bacterium]
GEGLISLRFYREEYKLVSIRLRFDDFLSVVEHPNCVICEVTEEQGEELLDRLADLLVSAGFHANDEPNSLGHQIEAMIDRVLDTLERQ